jgi:hypothetical protein
MSGIYQNFPQNIHRIETYTYSLSRRTLQQKLIQMLQKVNEEQYRFEDVGIPTIPNGILIFEFGIADTASFIYLNKMEAEKLLKTTSHGRLKVLDLFCSIRYYKKDGRKKKPQKFDYYIFRTAFGEKGLVEFSVVHERGPRYISPEELISFIVRKVNEASTKKVLKPKED